MIGCDGLKGGMEGGFETKTNHYFKYLLITMRNIWPLRVVSVKGIRKNIPPHVILDCTLQRKFQGYKYVKVMGKCDITYLDKHLMKILNIQNLKKPYGTFYSYSTSLMCEWWDVIFYLIFRQLGQQSKHNFSEQVLSIFSLKSQWKAGERKKFVPKG